jgi:hypothetical protein
MAITFVSSASENNTSIATMPTHQPGDLLVMCVIRRGSGSAVTPPAGWMGQTQFGADNQNINTFVRAADSSSVASGTWTDASALACLVYRVEAGETVFHADRRVNNGNSTTISGNFNQIGSRHNDGAWYIWAAVHVSTDTSIETPPSGFTMRESRIITSTCEWVVADTNGDPGSLPNPSASVGGTSGAWFLNGCQLAYFANWPSGSGGVPLIGPGGLVY